MEALGWIYKKYRVRFVQRMMTKWSCSEEEALEVYHDTVIELDRQVAIGKLSQLWGGGLGGWIFRTGNNKWHEKLRGIKKRKEKEHEWSWLESETAARNDSPEMEEIFLEELSAGLERLDGRCQKLLRYYYLENQSLKSIWEQMQFPSYAAAKMALRRCRERLREMIFSLKKSE